MFVNATTNCSYSNNTVHSLGSRDIVLVVTFCIIFLIGVTGNSLVCYLYNPKHGGIRISNTEVLIFYLGVIDLIASILNPLMFTYWTITDYKQWHFGYIGCKVLPSSTRVTISWSIGVILVITIDRCRVICQPYHTHFKQVHLRMAFFFTLILSILSELPFTIFHEYNGVSCKVFDAKNPKFLYPVVLIYISRDLFFIITFFTTIFFIHKELYDEEHIKTLRQQYETTKMKRIVKLLITIALIFIVLVFPREILHIVYYTSRLSPTSVIPHTKFIVDVNSLLKILHMCNSICNVFIYARLNRKFRKRLLNLVAKMFKQSRYYDYTLTNDNATFVSYELKDFSWANQPSMLSKSKQFRLTRIRSYINEVRDSGSSFIEKNNEFQPENMKDKKMQIEVKL